MGFNVFGGGFFCDSGTCSDVNSDVQQLWHSPNPVWFVRIFAITEPQFCNELTQDPVVFVCWDSVGQKVESQGLELLFEFGITICIWQRHALKNVFVCVVAF